MIGDTHIPFEHRNYLAFCKEVYKKYSCNTVVHIGDLVDNNTVSFHSKDADGFSAKEEMDKADKVLQKWYKAFPKVKVVQGNHCSLIERKAFHHELPKRVIKDFKDIWNFPKGWEYEYEYFIDGVRYFHGMGYSGKNAHVKAVTDNRCSCVIGHLHSNAGVEWTASEKDILFGLATGCGINRKAYAFKYGKDFVRKPILGCGVVLENGTKAQFIPMKK